MKLLILNGPNINFLGIREPDLYGRRTYQDLLEYLRAVCAREGVEAEFRQSNHEGDLIDAVQAAYGVMDGIVLNPAGYTHTSVALGDALKAVGLPAVEVHLTDISTRESYRRVSYTAEACIAQICGEGFAGYEKAILLLKEKLGK